MQQVKIFKSIETEVAEIEKNINDWISESGAKIVNIFGNIAAQSPPDPRSGGGRRGFGDSDIFIVVLYEQAEQSS